jgi:heterodisulfide reductase subunit A
MSGNKADKSEKTGVFLKPSFEEVSRAISFGSGIPKEDIIVLKKKRDKVVDEIAAASAKRGFTRLVLGGFSPVFDEDLILAAAERTGVPEAAVVAVSGPEASAFVRAIDRLASLTESELLRLPASNHVCVVGSGIAGTTAACELAEMGFTVSLIERGIEPGGALGRTVAEGDAGIPGLFEELPAGVELFLESEIERVDGGTGDFTVTVINAEGRRRIETGAVIVATGHPEDTRGAASLFEAPGVIPAGDLLDAVRSLPRKLETRAVGIVLDLDRDETVASSEMAFALGRAIQELGSFQVYLFCRDVRVADLPLEVRYDDFRESGAVVVKYSDLKISPNRNASENGSESVTVECFDENLGRNIAVNCRLVGVSEYGLEGRSYTETARRLGIDTDRFEMLQENNVHLMKHETNRPGIFAVGACRGTYYIPAAVEEAKAAALAVGELLRGGEIISDTLNARVDADKCVLCLTCIRSCPHKAMFVNREKGAAESYPQSCRRCGICAGECPAKAITLPAFSDEIILAEA